MRYFRIGDHILIGGLEYMVTDLVFNKGNFYLSPVYCHAQQYPFECLKSCVYYEKFGTDTLCLSPFFITLELLTEWVKERNKK